MPFWPPFLTAGERFVENTSSSTIKLITRLFQRFILIQSKALSPGPFGRGYLCPIGSINRYHAVGGANGTTMVHCGDVCGIVVVGLKGFSILFLPSESYRAGVFRSRPNPNKGIPVKGWYKSATDCATIASKMSSPRLPNTLSYTEKWS